MNNVLISQLVQEYKADPNCWPELWIASEALTSPEKAEFIRRALAK